MIVPRHDKMRGCRNVIVTDLAPNLVNEEALRLSGEKLKDRIKPGSSRRIGLLIGGNNSEFRLSVDVLRKVLQQVTAFCDSNGMDMLVTTSRRTNKEQENIIKDMLKDNPRCKLLVIANEDNPDGTVAGILALSDMVMVSGESISMVSEAVSAGRKVVAFKLDKKSGHITKHERVMDTLKKEGYIGLADAGELGTVLGSFSNSASDAKKIDDTGKIYEAMRALI